MIDESNPAGRLYKILSIAKKRPDGDKAIAVWAHALGIKNDEVTVTKGIVELYSLSHKVQSLIVMNNNLNHDLYLSSFNKIETAFFPLNLQAPWRNIKPSLTDESMTRLQFCAEELSKFYSEETLAPEDLKDIENKTNELFEELNSSSLPDELRLTLLEEVERIRHAINMYKVRGAKGLKDALQATIGAMVVNKEEIDESAKQNAEVIQKLGSLIDKLDSFAARALKLKRLAKKPIRFLLEQITIPSEELEEAVEIEVE